MHNPFHKVGKKISKAFGGGGNHGRRLSSIGGDLQQEDSQHTNAGGENANGAPNSPQLHPANDDKGIVQQISNGMENFFKAIVADNPKPMPIRTTVPEGEEEDDDADGEGKQSKSVEQTTEPEVVLDENTPVDVLLARIQYLETNLRAETLRSQGLEEQISQLEARCQDMERVIHTSLLSKMLRPFRVCFGGGPQPQNDYKKRY